MSSHNVPGPHHATSTGQPSRLEAGRQSTQNAPRTTWSESYLEKVRQEHFAVLAEFRAVNKQFFNSGHMTIDEYEPLRKQYMDRLDALSDEIDEELKKETPSMVQTAMDWGYSKEDAVKIRRNFLDRAKFYSRLRRNSFVHRRDVRGH
ncbi:hypothetical protein DENSPDRAFT_843732 [Dentipellis sp. KUC8613]|nr:hypothetical protein DENSPDRAFT_843732 [Dentipellis sp. KUC8613]